MTKKYLIILNILLLLFIFSGQSYAQHESRILQYKLDRLYFDAGKEAWIFPFHFFRVVCGGDTLFESYIDRSYSGVSISDTTGGFFDTLPLTDCTALIDTAGIMKVNFFEIGSYLAVPPLNQFLAKDLSPSPFESEKEITLGFQDNFPIKFYFWEELYQITEKFEYGFFDAFLSYQKLRRSRRNIEIISSPAPYYIALVPNPSKKINDGGMLATSIYYRLDDDRLDLMFPGEDILPRHTHYSDSTGLPRLYDYDPHKGHRLLLNMFNLPDEIQLGYYNRCLEKTGMYLADILSRDRIKMKILHDAEDPDMFLLIVPDTVNDLLSSLKYLHEFLSQYENLTKGKQEKISFLGNYIELAEDAATEEERLHFVMLADRVLQEDLAVFPLFQPTIFFHADESLINYYFEPNGLLNLVNLQKLSLPKYPPEVK